MLKVAGIVSLAVVAFSALVVLSSACTAGVVVPDDGGVGQPGNGNGNGNGNGGGASGGGGGSMCSVEAGTYKVHYTKVSGGSTCQAPGDSTIIISSADAGGFGSPSCTTTSDPTTCTTTSQCTATSKGITSTSDTTTTLSGSSGSGSIHQVVRDSMGNTTLDCTYSLTYTKE